MESVGTVKFVEVQKPNMETLDDLISALETMRMEIGSGKVRLNVSVLQESPANPFGSFYEDRSLAPRVEYVREGNMVELYV